LRRWLAIAMAFGALVTPGASDAAAADGELDRCVEAFDRGQMLRARRSLIGARAELLVCARDVCPSAMRSDCLKWIDEVDQDMGSLVVRAVDAAGKDLALEAVTVDGAVVESREGWAVPVDPGRRVVRVAVKGRPPAERTILVGQGEKNRSVVFQIESRRQAATEPRPEPGVPAIVFTAGGVAAVAFATFGYAAGTGWSELQALQDECGVSRVCSARDVDPVRTKLLVGDVAAAVGVVALGVAAYFLIDHLGGRRKSAARALTISF
jgi:hypothetical protein